MNSGQKTVFVLGAGFTKAFLPDAPIMVDDYAVEELLRKFEGFSIAKEILESEIERYPSGKINIERLMTRLDGLMPYDFKREAGLRSFPWKPPLK